MTLTHPHSVRALDTRGDWKREALRAALVIESLCLVFALDLTTGSAPLQHLYYVPIILAGLWFRTAGSLIAAGAAIVQYHLAGHTNYGKYIIDTHSDHVDGAVWDLYRRACLRTGNVSTLIEWDDDIPPFETLLDEAEKARAIRDECARAVAPEAKAADARAGRP